MAAEIITKDDLEDFRLLLIRDLKELMGKPPDEPKRFLKSFQVKNMLKISTGTLQNLRVNGTLPFSKIGGILYYKHEDVMKLLNGNK